MNDLKGILFLVLLKIISIASTNIDCSGNAFHCVNSTHFMICVDLGAGVSITIDDFIIPCPRATVCEQNNRFECEYPKAVTTAYPLGIIGVTKQEDIQIGSDATKTTLEYAAELPQAINTVATTVVTEVVTTLSNVKILNTRKLEADTNVESVPEITTVYFSSIPDAIIDANEITANVKIRTSTHESMYAPNNNLNVKSVIETAIDKPDTKHVVKEILNSTRNISVSDHNNKTKILYESITNRKDFDSSSNNGTFINKPQLSERNNATSIFNFTVNKQQKNYNDHNTAQNRTEGLSIANDTKITEHAPSTSWNDKRFTSNSNNTQNFTNFNQILSTASTIIQSEITNATLVPEYDGVNELRMVNEFSTETVLPSDIVTSQTITETPFTENGILIDQVNTLSIEATTIFNNIQTTDLVNQPNDLDSETYPSLSTENSTTNISAMYNVPNSDQSLPTTVIPLETTSNTLIKKYYNSNEASKRKYENHTETLLVKEFTTTRPTLTDNVLSTSQVSTLALESTYVQDADKISTNDLVHNSSYNNVNATNENSKSITAVVDVSTIDPFPSTIITEKSTEQTMSSTIPVTSIISGTNKPETHYDASIEIRTVYANKVGLVSVNEFTTTETSNNDVTFIPTATEASYIDNVNVETPLENIDQNTTKNNITSGSVYDTTIDKSTTEHGPLIITTERFTTNSSNMQTVTGYDQTSNTALITETSDSVSVIDIQTRIADEFSTTMASLTDINLFTKPVNISTDASLNQDVHVDNNPDMDLIIQSTRTKVYQIANDDLQSTDKTLETTNDQSLWTTSPEKYVDSKPNNTERDNDEIRLISTATTSPSLETTTLNLVQEKHGFVETKAMQEETNENKTTVKPYYTGNYLNVPLTNLTTKQFDKSDLNKLINQENKQINMTLQVFNNTMTMPNKIITKEQDLISKEGFFISSSIQPTNKSTVNITTSYPLEATDHGYTKTIDELTTYMNITTNNIFKKNEINITQPEVKYPILRLNQTNHSNLNDVTSTLITETLVNIIGITESPTLPTLTESYNSSYSIQQDRDSMINVSTTVAEPVVPTIIPDYFNHSNVIFNHDNSTVLQVNHSGKINILKLLNQDVKKINATSRAIKEHANYDTVPSTIGTDPLFEENIDKTRIILDDQQNISTLINLDAPPILSIHVTGLEAEYNKKNAEELKTTTETIFTGSATLMDEIYIETQVDMYQDILNRNSNNSELADLQEFQKLQDGLINKNNKDAAIEIRNEISINKTSIIQGIPLTTTKTVYNDIGLNPTRLIKTKELQKETSNVVITSTTQRALEPDNIVSVLSNNEKGSQFMTPTLIEPITDKTNAITIKLITDKTFEPRQNNTPTPLSSAVEILSTATSSVLYETSTAQFIVDHSKAIIETTKVNTIESHADTFTKLTRPLGNTGDLTEELLLKNRTENISKIPFSSNKTVDSFDSSSSTSISSSSQSNITNTSTKNDGDIGILTYDITLDVDNASLHNMVNIRMPEAKVENSSHIKPTINNIVDFVTHLSAGNIVQEPIEIKYTNIGSVDASSPDSVRDYAPHDITLKLGLGIETAVSDKGTEQNNTLLNNYTRNGQTHYLNNTAILNKAIDNSIPDKTNTSSVAIHRNTNDHNITDNVFTVRDNKTTIEDLTITESSTSRLQSAVQNNVIHLESSLTTEPGPILLLSALDINPAYNNQMIHASSPNILSDTSTKALPAGTPEPIEYLGTMKNLDTKENVLLNSHVPKEDDIGLQLPNESRGTDNINNPNQSTPKLDIVNVNLITVFNNQSDAKDLVRTVNTKNASDIQYNKQPNHTINTIKLNVNITTNGIMDDTNLNVSNKTIVGGVNFNCLNRSRGKYADNNDCRKFYMCIGRPQPLTGTCPLNTVFSEINKQCTRNLSHCVRNNQFRCLLEGRFSDFFKDNVYYICIKHSSNNFMRYKLQCQNGFHLNKETIKCESNIEVSSVSESSVSENSQKSTDNSESKQNPETSIKGSFECEKEGQFPHPDDCRKYYVCSKNNKAEFRRKIKHCSSDEVFHIETKKCIESESYVC